MIAQKRFHRIKQQIWPCFLLAFPKNCENLNDKTSQHQNRSQSNVLEIEHFFIEDIGVVGAAANHQDETQNDEGETYQHDDVILFSERHNLLVIFTFCGHFFICFLCHNSKFVQRYEFFYAYNLSMCAFKYFRKAVAVEMLAKMMPMIMMPT